MRHVIHEHGHVGTLPGEHHLRGDMVGAEDRRAHLVEGAHRLPDTRVDVIATAEGGPQRRGPRVRAEDADGVVDVRRVPPHKLRHALRQKRRAELLTLPCATQPRVAPKEAKAWPHEGWRYARPGGVSRMPRTYACPTRPNPPMWCSCFIHSC